jgi:hypothetical protein
MTFDFENPPLLNAVPAGAENIALGALAAILALVVATMMLRARADERGTVLLCLIGGALAVVFDAQFSVLTLRWFPAIDSSVLYASSGRVVPVFWLLFQAAYVGGGVAWLITGKRAATAAQLDAWNAVWLLLLSRLLLEIGGVNLGLWSYYGWQPFSVFGVPLWMPVLSAVAVVAAARFVQFSLTTHHRATLLIGVPLSYSIAVSMQAWPIMLALNHRDGNVVWASAAMVGAVILAGILVETLRRLPTVHGSLRAKG